MGDRDGGPGLFGKPARDGRSGRGQRTDLHRQSKDAGLRVQFRIQLEEAPEEMIFHSRKAGFPREVRPAREGHPKKGREKSNGSDLRDQASGLKGKRSLRTGALE